MLLSTICQRMSKQMFTLGRESTKWGLQNEACWLMLLTPGFLGSPRVFSVYIYSGDSRTLSNHPVGWGEEPWSGPGVIPFEPQSIWSVGICPTHFPQWKPVLSYLKLFSSKSSNLIYGNDLSYMHGCFLWCIIFNVISKLGLRKTNLTIFKWICWYKVN